MRKLNEILVSIITPSYNSSEFISNTINSVLSQTFHNWELIIIDDCSKDNSIEVISQWCEKDSRIQLIQLTENSGAAVARNKGIEVARGRYIAFLDSDDKWLPDKLEKQLQFMRDNQYNFTFTAYNKVNPDGDYLGELGVPHRIKYSDLLKKCEIGCLTAMYDTEELGKVYMPLIRKRQDLGLWLKLLKQTEYAFGLNQVLASYTVRNDSISSNKRKAAIYTWKLYREVEALPLYKAAYYFSHYAVNGVLRTKFPRIAKALGIIK